MEFWWGRDIGGATDAHWLSFLAGYTIPRAVSPFAKCFAESLPSTLDGCIIRAPETQQERMLFGILVGGWRVAVRTQGGELPQRAFQASEREINTGGKEERIQ
jgi:hypothetical protein